MLGIEELAGPADAGVTGDRPVPPGSIRIFGSVVHTALGNSPLPLARVELIGMAGSDGAVTTADEQGRFELIVDGEGGVDGSLRSSDPVMESVNPTVTLFATPLTADTEVTLQNIDQPSVQQLASLCGVPAIDPGAPFFAISASGGGGPSQGIPVMTTPPGQFCSISDGMNPQVGNTTGSDGFVFAFGIPPGLVDIQIGAGVTRRVDALPTTTYFVPFNL